MAPPTHIPNRKLSNGLEIPAIGLGTYKEEHEQVLINAIKAAIKIGVRHFDCAYIYYNENHIGRALREAIDESNGELKREDFFIVSKLWNSFHSKEKVAWAIDDTLKKFGLEYLDLFLMHWPMGFREDADYPYDENKKLVASDVHYTETYQALEELVEQGKVKAIGLSNFNVQQIKDILAISKVRPVCNQIEVNPLFHNDEVVDYCKSENIAVVAFAPLGAPDRAWLKSDDPVPLKHPFILDLAKKYNKSPAQIILRWLFQRDIIVIPKSVTPSRIEENTRIFDFSLSDEDFAGFKENFKQQFRFYVFEDADLHPFYPFRKTN